MQNVTNNFKSAVKKSARELKAFLKISNEAITIDTDEINQKDLISFKWDRGMQSGDVLTGNAFSQRLEINLFNFSEEYEYIKKGTMIKLRLSLKDLEDEVISPTFYVDEITKDKANKTIQIIAYDILFSCQRVLKSVFNLNDTEESTLPPNPYNDEITCINYAEKFLAGLGADFDSSNIEGFYEDDLRLYTEPNLSGEEDAREVIGKLAQIYFANAYVNKDDKIVFIPIVGQSEAVQIDSSDYFEFETLEPMNPTTVLNLALEPQQDYIIAETLQPENEIVKLMSDESENEDNLDDENIVTETQKRNNEFKITNNPFLDFQRTYEIKENFRVVDLMFEKIYGFQITPYKLKWRDFLYLEPGDKILINKSIENGEIQNIYSLYGNSSINYDGGVITETSLESSGEDSNLSIAESIVDVTKYTSLMVDKLNGEISQIIKQTEKLDDIITQKTNEIISDVEKTNQTISLTGGNNLIRNSAFFKIEDIVVNEETSIDRPADKWVVRNQNDFKTNSSTDVEQNTVSKNELLLSNGTISQILENRLIIGEYYTLSFNMKCPYFPLGKYALVQMFTNKDRKEYVTNDDNIKAEFSIQSALSKAETITFTFKAKTHSPEIVIKTNKTNGNILDEFAISDLRLVKGYVSQEWSQYSDEVYGKNILIDREGVIVKSLNDEKKKLKMDHNSIEIFSNETQLSEFSSEKVSAPRAEFKDNISISGVSFVGVTNGRIFITKGGK